MFLGNLTSVVISLTITSAGGAGKLDGVVSCVFFYFVFILGTCQPQCQGPFTKKAWDNGNCISNQWVLPQWFTAWIFWGKSGLWSTVAFALMSQGSICNTSPWDPTYLLLISLFYFNLFITADPRLTLSKSNTSTDLRIIIAAIC